MKALVSMSVFALLAMVAATPALAQDSDPDVILPLLPGAPGPVHTTLAAHHVRSAKQARRKPIDTSAAPRAADQTETASSTIWFDPINRTGGPDLSSPSSVPVISAPSPAPVVKGIWGGWAGTGNAGGAGTTSGGAAGGSRGHSNGSW